MEIQNFVLEESLRYPTPNVFLPLPHKNLITKLQSSYISKTLQCINHDILIMSSHSSSTLLNIKQKVFHFITALPVEIEILSALAGERPSVQLFLFTAGLQLGWVQPMHKPCNTHKYMYTRMCFLLHLSCFLSFWLAGEIRPYSLLLCCVPWFQPDPSLPFVNFFQPARPTGGHLKRFLHLRHRTRPEMLWLVGQWSASGGGG